MNFREALLDAIDRVVNRVHETLPGDEEYTTKENLLNENVVPGADTFIPKAGANSEWVEIIREEGDFYYGDEFDAPGIYEGDTRILVLAGVEMGHSESVIQLWPYYFKKVN